MKKFYLIAFLCIGIFTLLSCSSDDDNLPKALYPEYIDVDPSKESLTDQEQEALCEVGRRVAEHLTEDSNGIIALSATAQELNICQPAYDTVQKAIVWYNLMIEAYPIPNSAKQISRGKMEGETATRGNNEFSDMIAGIISGVFDCMDCPTSKKYFNMWYFDNRSDDYIMAENEWAALLPYSDAKVKDTYKQCSTTVIRGATYHQVPVSFYVNTNDSTEHSAEEMDLMFTYGASTLYYTQSGKAAGFRDKYDFNVIKGESHRGDFMEMLVGIVNLLGGGEGYNIYYGAGKP